MGNASGVPLAARERRELRRLVSTLGHRAACRRLGIGRGTLDRAIAGLGLSRLTRDRLRTSMQAPTVSA